MIRPIDLQNTILQSVQNAPAVQRAEDGSRLTALAVAAQFSAEIEHREGSVAATDEVTGNRIDAEAGTRDDGGGGKRKRKREGQSPFEDVVEDAAGAADEPHLIDFTA